MTEQTPQQPERLKGAARQAALTKARFELHARHIQDVESETAWLRAEFAHLAEQQAASAIEPRTMAAAAPGPPLRGLTPDEFEARRAAPVPQFLAVRGEQPALAPPPADDRPQVMWQLRDGSNLMSTRPGYMEQRSTADPIADPLGARHG